MKPSKTNLKIGFDSTRIGEIPTDLELLNTIYDLYHERFVLYDQDEKTRETRVMVPIDCKKVADILKVNQHIIFGRLHFHLEKKYGYKLDDEPERNARVRFFSLEIGKDRHCINFPLLVSVLACLRQERENFWISNAIALFAVFISLISLGLGSDIWMWELIQFLR